MVNFKEITGELKFEKERFSYYEKLLPELMSEIGSLSLNLRNLPVININSTSDGGGVAEMLKSQIPFERKLGIDSRWFVLEGVNFSRKFLDLLQGESGTVSYADKEKFFFIGRQASTVFSRVLKEVPGGIIIIHDPQPLPLIEYIPSNFAVIVRLHSDLSTPNQEVIRFLTPYLERADAVVVSCPEYVEPFLPTLSDKIQIISPAIDVTIEKNKIVSLKEARRILARYGIDTQRPIISQVSRFDPWKDPWGVIEAFDLVKKTMPSPQLVLAGLMVAKDDPGAKKILNKVKKMVRGRQDIYLFYDPEQLKGIDNNQFIRALYTASDVVIQKSIREGFGLTISEAMWKEKPVVVGKTAGAVRQVEDGKNGVVVASAAETATVLVRLLQDKSLRSKLGKEAHKSVKAKFLLPRMIAEHLKLYESVREKQNLETRKRNAKFRTGINKMGL